MFFRVFMFRAWSGWVGCACWGRILMGQVAQRAGRGCFNGWLKGVARGSLLVLAAPKG